MSDSLSTLITKVQNALGDASGTYFSTAIVTAAAREALKIYNQYVPVNAGTLITGVNNQYEYELSDEDSRAMNVLGIWQKGANNNEIDTPLTYDDYNEDERIFFRLRYPITTSDTLIVRYNIPHTINGLDSAVESTVPAWQDPILVIGIGAEAARIRARSRTETINLSADQSDNYLQQAQEMKAEFLADLKSMAKKKKAPVGEPDLRGWNDQYYYWNQ